MPKRRTKQMQAKHPYLNLAADVIIDALLIASGKSPASKETREAEAARLRSEQCRRWAWVCGVDIEVALNHRDCVIRTTNE